jgi:hypothetical protein
VNIDEFAGKLEGVKKQGRGFVARCPAHADKRASLGFTEGDDGRVLCFCYAGCTFDQIVGSMGLQQSDLMPPTRDLMKKVWKREKQEDVYDYRNLDGTLAYQVVRKVGKDFRQRRKDASGEWLWNMQGVKRLLYRLPEVIAAIKDHREVWLVEGEKDVHAMEAAGAVATTITGGVLKKHGEAGVKEFRDLYAPYLRGANVKMVADNDQKEDGKTPGQDYAKQVVAALTGIADSITVYKAKHGKDAADHLTAGNTIEDFVRWRELEPKLPFTVLRMSDVKELPVDWLWEPYVPRKYGTLVEGDGDVGKSYMTCGVMACLSNGYLPTGEYIGPQNCVYFASEDEAADTIKPRLRKFGADMSRIYVIPELFALDAIGLQYVQMVVGDIRPALIAFDPILAYIGAAVNVNASNEVRPVLDGLKRIYSRMNAAGWHIRHERKPGKSKDGKPQNKGHHEGLGSVDIRNAHRSQLVVRWHPEQMGLRVVAHEKHNLSSRGDCFGYEFKHGQFGWVEHVDMPEDWGDKPPVGFTTLQEVADVRQAVEGILLGGATATWNDLTAAASKVGGNACTLRKVKREMGLQFDKAQKVFLLPGDYDPFAGAGAAAAPPAWAGLDD